ncbi:MAG: alpha/beta fold hydrolase, partial [Pseudomonadota bacterium]
MAVDLNIIEIAADGAETEPPLVVAHGLFGSAKNFSSLGRKLADGRRVVLTDMRNHGDSPWHDDVTYPAMAED